MTKTRLASLSLLAFASACQTSTDDIADDITTDDDLACVEPEPSPEILAQLAPFANPELPAEETPEELAKAGKTRIEVIFHVIRRKAGGAGDHSRARIDKTIAAMNEQYARSRFRFHLKAITRTTSASWYAMSFGSRAEHRAKRRLHRGNAETLNIYTSGGGGGWGTWPWDQAGAPKLDGIVVKNDGGAADTTYSHEAGHWLGLFHTHQGGCSTPGDHVADTPAEQDPNGFLQACSSEDSCPSMAGNDPIHNLMAYTTCRDRFTRGQRNRIAFLWDIYRELCRPIPVCTADASKSDAPTDLDWSVLPPDEGEAWPETEVELVD